MTFISTSSFRATLPESPFLDNLPSFLRSKELEALLSGSVQTFSAPQISKLVEEEEDIDDVRVFERVILVDKNNDGELDQDNDVDFFVKIFYCRNAVKLENLYSITIPDENEILIFIEDQTGDKISGRKIFIKIDDLLKIKFQEKTSEPDLIETSIVRTIDNESVGKRVVELIKAGYGEIENVGQFNAFLQYTAYMFMKKAEEVNDFVMDIPIRILGNIVEGIRSWEFTPEAWDPSTAKPHKAFVPQFFPFLKFKHDGKAYFNVKGPEIALDTAKEELLKNIDIQFKLFNFALDKSYKGLADAMENMTFGIVEFGELNHHPLHGMVNRISDILQKIIGAALDIMVTGALFMNALICGLINSLIEIVAGIFDIIRLVFMLTKGSTNMLLKARNWTEYLDNMLQTLEEIDLLAVTSRVNVFVSDFMGQIGSAVWAWFGSISTADVGYCIGFIIGFIIEQILEGIFTAGIGNTVSMTRNTIRSAKAVFDLFADIVKKVLKEMGENFLSFGKNIGDMIEAFLAFIRKVKTEGLIKIMDDLWKAFVKWLDELKGVSKAVIARYARKFEYEFSYRPNLKVRKAYQLHGLVGKKLVMEVDDAVETIIKTTSKTKREEEMVMVSGMLYKDGSRLSEVHAYHNFSEKEIGELGANGRYLGKNGKASVYQDFMDNLHPALKKRLKEHMLHHKTIVVDKDIIRQKAGIMGTHGEIRALNALLKSIDPVGKLGDDVFKKIYAYNRFLRKGATEMMPRCMHCRYITDGINMIF